MDIYYHGESNKIIFNEKISTINNTPDFKELKLKTPIADLHCVFLDCIFITPKHILYEK